MTVASVVRTAGAVVAELAAAILDGDAPHFDLTELPIGTEEQNIAFIAELASAVETQSDGLWTIRVADEGIFALEPSGFALYLAMCGSGVPEGAVVNEWNSEVVLITVQPAFSGLMVGCVPAALFAV